jgi:hypothetical protein
MSLTDDDARMLNNLMKKDQGPMLYWLVNERPYSPATFSFPLMAAPEAKST